MPFLCPSGCSTPPAQRTLIIAHRGASFDAPENTIAAFRLAWEQGADGIEGDFHLTADGVVVCCHDPTTGRTAPLDLACARASASDVVQLDVGSWKGPAWRGERMPTLDEVLANVPDGKRVFIEIKSGPDTIAPARAAIRDSRLRPEQIRIISFHTEVIRESKRVMPAITANWLTGFEHGDTTDQYRPTVTDIIETASDCRADGVGIKAAPHIDTAFVKELETAGLGLHIWTVNDPATAQRFIDLGAQSITTDRPGWLRAQLDRTDALP